MNTTVLLKYYGISDLVSLLNDLHPNLGTGLFVPTSSHQWMRADEIRVTRLTENEFFITVDFITVANVDPLNRACLRWAWLDTTGLLSAIWEAHADDQFPGWRDGL